MHKKVLFESLLFFFFFFFLNSKFLLFPILKMNANYAQICRVGNLEADFLQGPLAQYF